MDVYIYYICTYIFYNMDTKLTLKLDKAVIERAKHYAAAKQLSLSRLIEHYLASLTTDTDSDVELSPFVKSIASGKSIPVDIDEKREYMAFLEKKYR